jgi:hypothetical protein
MLSGVVSGEAANNRNAKYAATSISRFPLQQDRNKALQISVLAQLIP